MKLTPERLSMFLGYTDKVVEALRHAKEPGGGRIFVPDEWVAEQIRQTLEESAPTHPGRAYSVLSRPVAGGVEIVVSVRGVACG